MSERGSAELLLKTSMLAEWEEGGVAGFRLLPLMKLILMIFVLIRKLKLNSSA